MKMTEIKHNPTQTLFGRLPLAGIRQATQPLFAGLRFNAGPAADTVQLSRTAQPRFAGLPWMTRNPMFSPSHLQATEADFGDLRRHDPDLDEWMDMLDGKTTEDYLLDQIVNDNIQVDADGSIVINKPRIDIPIIHHGNKSGGGGVGSGEGNEGDPINGQPGEEPGEGDEAGKEKGNPPLKPWQQRFSPSEIARLVGNQFGLPFMRPSDGESNRVRVTKDSTKEVPPGDLHRKKTFRNAVRRVVGGSIAQGEQPDFNEVFPIRPDRVYKAIEHEPQPNLKVAVIYVADVSGSVDENLRTFTRNANRFVSYPLKYKYGQLAAELAGEDYSDAEFFGKDGTEDGGLKERFIVYTTEANETTEEDFYKTTQSGGTQCSSGFKKAQEIIEEEYPPSEGWNVYVYHFSDGDNWGDDNAQSVKIMKEMISSGVRYIGSVDLGKPNNRPSNFRSGIDGAFKGDPHVGTIGVPRKGQYNLDDYKGVISTFLPPQKEELEWYDTDVAA